MLHPESQNDLSLRKRQTILVDVPKQRSKGGLQPQKGLQPQRSVSRRVSTHVRGRSVSRALDLNDTAKAPAIEIDDPESLMSKLAAASAEELSQHLEALKLQQAELEQQDQAAVRRNYETLVAVSHSIAELPPQLGRLRKQVTDLASIANALRIDATDSQDEDLPPSARKSAPRASMLMLNSAWRQDLVALFRKVEGAQKFLPPIPGRHVVSDSGGWDELNAVTWTSTKRVHLFIISDHLLIAQKSSRALTVDHCWPLQDVRATQRDKALQIQVPGGTWAYGAPNSKTLEQVFRDLTKAKSNLQSNISHQASTLSRHPSEHVSSHRKASIAATEVETARMHARELAGIDLKIATRDWSAATDLCLTLDIPGIEERRKSLETTLLSLAPRGGQPLSLLASLGLAEEAIEVYLSERAKLIATQVSYVTFRGDIVSHLSQVAVVYFQLIIATVRAFCAAFPSAQEAARIVSWTKQQLELYAEVFNRQLYKIRPGTRVYTQCIEATRCESAQLRELGLDMDFLLDYVWE